MPAPLKDFHWLRNRKTGTEPKTLFWHKWHDATMPLGNPKLAYTYMDSARMWTDTLVQHNLTQQMAEFNVKYHTQEKELEIAHLQQEQLEHQAFLLKASHCCSPSVRSCSHYFVDARHQETNSWKEDWTAKARKRTELGTPLHWRVGRGMQIFCQGTAWRHSQRPAGAANEDRNFCRQREWAGTGLTRQQTEKQRAEYLTRTDASWIRASQSRPDTRPLCAAKLTENTGIEVSYHPTENNASRHLPQWNRLWAVPHRTRAHHEHRETCLSQSYSHQSPCRQWK